MGLILLPIMLGIFLVGFVPALILILRIKYRFPWYFRNNIHTIVHFILALFAVYIGYKHGWNLVNSNLPSANDGFGSDKSGFHFLVGLLLPGIYCFAVNCILLLLGKLYFNAHTK